MMKTFSILIPIVLLLSSCGVQRHGNFNKQKFTRLKSIQHFEESTHQEEFSEQVSVDHRIDFSNTESSEKLPPIISNQKLPAEIQSDIMSSDTNELDNITSDNLLTNENSSIDEFQVEQKPAEISSQDETFDAIDEKITRKENIYFAYLMITSIIGLSILLLILIGLCTLQYEGGAMFIIGTYLMYPFAFLFPGTFLLGASIKRYCRDQEAKTSKRFKKMWKFNMTFLLIPTILFCLASLIVSIIMLVALFM